MNVHTLYDAIAEVCPVYIVTVNDPDDREQWSFVPGENATTNQILAGENVIATIPAETLGSLATAEFISRWTNAEYRALQDRRMADNGKMGKDWDVTTADSVIPLDKKRTKSLKADLVTQNILTQARADEIFS